MTRAPARHAVRVEPFPDWFASPERTTERIGEYMGAPIFRSVYIDGAEYVYDRIQPRGIALVLAEGERCVPPGIVYSRQA